MIQNHYGETKITTITTIITQMTIDKAEITIKIEEVSPLITNGKTETITTTEAVEIIMAIAEVIEITTIITRIETIITRTETTITTRTDTTTKMTTIRMIEIKTNKDKSSKKY